MRTRATVVLVATIPVLGLGAAAPQAHAWTAPTTASRAAATTTPGGFVALPQATLVDTRAGTGAPQRPVASQQVLDVLASGEAGIPATGAKAVLLNVTALGGTAAGRIKIWSYGAPLPHYAALDFAARGRASNEVVAEIGEDGRISFANDSSAPADLVVTTVGYIQAGTPTAAGAIVPLAPARILDTAYGIGTARARVAPGGTVAATVAGHGGIPATGAADALVDIGVGAASAAGDAVAYRADLGRPQTASVTFSAGQSVRNLSVVPLAADGSITLANESAGTVDLSVDVVGWIRSGPAVADATMTARFPQRYTEDVDHPLIVPANGDATLTLGGGRDLPDPGLRAAVLELRTSHAGATGTLAVFPSGTARPHVALFGLAPGATIGDLVTLPLGTDGNWTLHNWSSAPVQVSADLLAVVTDGTLGAISGRVVNPAGTPVAGARVTLAEQYYPSYDGHDAITAADGTYTIGAVPPDTYSLCWAGHAATGGTAHYGYTDTCLGGSRDESDPVTVEQHLVSSGIDQTLSPAGAISGTVTDEAGHPLGGVVIRPEGAPADTTAVTATDGSYTVRGLDSYRQNYWSACGDWTGHVTGGTSMGGYLSSCNNSSRYVAPGHRLTAADITLAAGGGVTGVVTDSANRPIQGVAVTVGFGGEFTVGGDTTTGPHGVFTVRGLEPDSRYTLCFDGEDVPVSATAPDGYTDRCFKDAVAAAGQPIDIPGDVPTSAGSLTSGIDQSLPPAASVTGTVRDQSGPRAGVPVQIYEHVNSIDALVGSTTTGADGTYRADSIPPGTVTVCFLPAPAFEDASADGYVNQCYKNVDPLDAKANVPVFSGQVSKRIDAVLTHGGGISGTVTDDSGIPVPGVEVSLGRTYPQRSGTTDADGKYSFEHVEPGAHTVCFTAPEGSGLLDQCYDDVAPGGVAQPVTVTAESDTTGVDAHLHTALSRSLDPAR